MALVFFRDFADDVVGQQPAGFTSRGGDPSTWEIVEDASFTGGRALRRVDTGVHGTDNGYPILTVDALGEQQDVEILVRARTNSNIGYWTIGCVARSNDAADQGHLGGHWHSSDWAVSTLDNPSGTIDDVFSWGTPSGWIWIRFRLNGDQRLFRIWSDGSSEPANWSMTSTVSVGAGYVGVVGRVRELDYDIISIATDGDTAPSTEPEGYEDPGQDADPDPPPENAVEHPQTDLTATATMDVEPGEVWAGQPAVELTSTAVVTVTPSRRYVDTFAWAEIDVDTDVMAEVDVDFSEMPAHLKVKVVERVSAIMPVPEEFDEFGRPL